MLRVRLITDPFDLGSYTEHKPKSLIPFLMEHFPSWPTTAHLYKDSVATGNDVTPGSECDLALLEDDGLYYVVVYPEGPVAIIALAVVAVVALAVVMYMLMPKIPAPGSTPESANNSIGNRSNKARPNGRIPDIFGSVISVPELLTVPLLFFEDDVELELCYMCVGRGAYDITEVKDGETLLNLIAGAGAEFYGPNTSPNSGAAQLEIGTDITHPLYDVIKLNEVNGQLLRPPDSNAITGSGNIKLVAPDTIVNSGGIDFTDYFAVGDDLTINGANFGGSVAVFDATTQNCRFYPDKRIEFETFDPATLYAAGQTLVVSNAGFAGPGSAVDTIVYVDVSGTYEIVSVDSATRIIQLA